MSGARSYSRELCCLFGILGERSPQLKDFWWPLTLHFLTALTAQINELNSELEGEKKTSIKYTGTTDFFRGKLKLRKTQRKRLSGQKAQSFYYKSRRRDGYWSGSEITTSVFRVNVSELELYIII